MADLTREPKPAAVSAAFYNGHSPELADRADRLRIISSSTAGARSCAAARVQFPLAFGLFLTFIEFVGGLCISVGLFTRFFAAAAAIEMGYLTFIQYWANGYGWRTDGYEYVMMWGLLAFAIALRGGGPCRSIA